MNRFGIKNYKHKRQVIQHLIDLGRYKIEPMNSDKGICSELYLCSLRIDGYIIVEKLSIGWSHHTGIYNLPIPGNYNQSSWRYNSKQGKLRRSLCLFLANKLTTTRLSYKKENANESN